MRLLVVCAVVPALWACTNAPPTSSEIVQNPRQKLEENLKVAEISCASADECPENVGYIIANVGDDRISQCTGWLIAPDVVATNSHCIPEAMKENPSTCRQDLGIKMPATPGREEEVLLCAELLHFSKITPGSISKADFAFFRVTTPTTRAPLKLARTGISPGQKLTLFSVDPQSKVMLRGKLVRHECTASRGFLLATEETLFAYGDKCEVRKGNSGSPVLNASGAAVGWLHAGILKKGSASETLSPAILTNAACIPKIDALPEIGAPNPACEKIANN